MLECEGVSAEVWSTIVQVDAHALAHNFLYLSLFLCSSISLTLSLFLSLPLPLTLWKSVGLYVYLHCRYRAPQPWAQIQLCSHQSATSAPICCCCCCCFGLRARCLCVYVLVVAPMFVCDCTLSTDGPSKIMENFITLLLQANRCDFYWLLCNAIQHFLASVNRHCYCCCYAGELHCFSSLSLSLSSAGECEKRSAATTTMATMATLTANLTTANALEIDR